MKKIYFLIIPIFIFALFLGVYLVKVNYDLDDHGLNASIGKALENFKAQNTGVEALAPELFTPLASGGAEGNELEKVQAQVQEIKKITSNLSELNKKIKELYFYNFFKKKKTLKEFIEVAKARKEILLKIAKANSLAFLQEVLPKEEKGKLPEEIQQYLEQEVTVEGELKIKHFDDFDNGKSENNYSLELPNGSIITLYFTEPKPEILFSLIGTQVSFSGIKLENIMVIPSGDKGNIEKSLELLPSLPSLPVSQSVVKKTAVILLNFQNDSSEPFTPAEVQGKVFTNSDSVNKFYKENSYNQLRLEGVIDSIGDVFGWYTVPFDNTPCNYGGWRNTASTAAAADGFVSTNYDLIIYVFPHTDSCYWAGLALGGSNTSLINNYPDFLGVVSHEIGHNLGLWIHANGYDCGNQTLDTISNCQNVEYGNHFDVMGNKGYSRHFNGFFKAKLSWIGPPDTPGVSSYWYDINQSGTYTLSPLETLSGKKFAKILIPNFNSQFVPFLVEYRRGIGFDSRLNDPDLVSNESGLFVYANYPYNDPFYSFWSSYHRIIDVLPTSAGWSDDLKSSTIKKSSPIKSSTITTGSNTFTDPRTGITIGPIISSTPTSVSFKVSYQTPMCFSSPTIDAQFFNYNYPNNSLNQDLVFEPGSRFIIQTFTTNNDNPLCGYSNFKRVISLPTSWLSSINSSWQPSDFNSAPPILPGATQEEGSPIGNIPDDALGIYDILISSTNIQSGLTTTETFTIKIPSPPLPYQSIEID